MAATKKAAGKTATKRPPLRGAALVEEVIAGIERSGTARKALGADPEGLSEAALAGLTFPDGRPLPPSLRRWLAYDARWLEWFDDLAHPTLPARSFHRMMVEQFDERTADGWDFSDMLPGSCYVVPGGSDSRTFLYVGVPDDAGEYPILLVDTDDVPFLCVELPGFDVYLATIFDAVKLKGGDTYAGVFDDPTYGPAMVQQARLNLHGFKSFDLGGDIDHVDGPEAAEAATDAIMAAAGDRSSAC